MEAIKNTGIGQVYMTRAINDTIADDTRFTKFILRCFGRFLRHDWGDLCAEDKQLNDDAVKSGDGRLYARYNDPKGADDVLIITEWDHSCTTIMFRAEY